MRSFARDLSVTACSADTASTTISSLFTRMAHYPRWRELWSTYNLSSFLTWFHHYATEEDKQSVLHLFTVEHRRATTPGWLAANAFIPQEVPLQVTVNGKEFALPKRRCSEDNCERCISGRGGYQFRWFDQRWTPLAALDLKLTPEQVNFEMYNEPWPRGLRAIPRGRGATACSSSCSISPRPTGSSQTAATPKAWICRTIPEPPLEKNVKL